MKARGVRQFEDAVGLLPKLLTDLRTSPGHRVADHPAIPSAAGVYLFSEGRRPIYVGQSRNLRRRLSQHTGATRRENEASFAFNIAKREAARAGLALDLDRRALEANLDFVPYFDDARAAVAAMRVQYIELVDPVERTLFEVYASLALGTGEFNSWETH